MHGISQYRMKKVCRMPRMDTLLARRRTSFANGQNTRIVFLRTVKRKIGLPIKTKKDSLCDVQRVVEFRNKKSRVMLMRAIETHCRCYSQRNWCRVMTLTTAGIVDASCLLPRRGLSASIRLHMARLRCPLHCSRIRLEVSESKNTN